MTVGVAVVGAGHWGPHLIRSFNDHSASQTMWVVDTTEERRNAVSARFPSVLVTGQLEVALEDDRVHAVVVATPTSTHNAIARLALEAGKHVLVEKPIAGSLKDAIALCELAEDRRRILMVGHVFLFNAAVLDARVRIERGELGRLRYISMTRTNLGPIRFDVGASWDLASHDISIANYWLNSVPQFVAACGGSWLNPGILDAAFITLTYPDDIMVNIEASWLNPRKRRLISVIGSERMLTVDDMDLNEPLRVYDKGVVETAGMITDTFAGFRSQIREGQVLIPHITTGEPLRAECNAFLDRIHGDSDRTSDGWAGADVVAVLEAIDRSILASGLQQKVAAVR